MENRSAKHMWADFLDAHPEFARANAPETIQFFTNENDADRHAQLVLNKSKTATSFSLLGIQNRKESLPKIGSFLIVVDGRGNAQCIVRITSSTLKPWFNITEDYSRRDGFDSLTQWKETYWSYFSSELSPFRRSPQESMIVVCVSFEKVYG
ncbi:ASCH domain-containing protein [Arenibacter latericius]|uniref:ASCH domain-containing protein n=1 Tax=Arenibacter latericius TaxID=86104 RepID=UPI0003F51208|nr:ASCH domain-containing protein [Arenibacter latericius]MDX1363858.1 ASCH domain-containing protein [Arenibacter latericius]